MQSSPLWFQPLVVATALDAIRNSATLFGVDDYIRSSTAPGGGVHGRQPHLAAGASTGPGLNYYSAPHFDPVLYVRHRPEPPICDAVALPMPLPSVTSMVTSALPC